MVEIEKRGRGRGRETKVWRRMRLQLQGLHLQSSSGQTLRPAAPPIPCRGARAGNYHRRRVAASAAGPLVSELDSPISRRTLAVGGALLPLLLRPVPSMAEDEDQPGGAACGHGAPTQKAFLDVSIDGEPAGRIVVGLFGADVPGGAARFAGLVSGATGITYRRKPFIKIMPGYIQHGGIRAGEPGAAAAGDLVAEWEKNRGICRRTKNVAGSVGMIVRDPSKPPPKLKLVARKGKLEIDEEEVGTGPNGTEFVIATKDSPELDDSTLVVGRVIAGMEVAERIAAVKTVKENTASPYFRVAKLIGDKRAVVAERGFNRPYSKVVVTNCGLLD